MQIHQLKRCAIYTRKSSEEGLEQDFNSLDAQREACEAFVKSQAGEGWRLIKTLYDDGGLSGATMERPALQRLLADIREYLVDVVVVYKVDRLTRSLADFAKMVEVFDAQHVSFVAVTQQFNTTTSMGRLTLNVLLSFAQFEREVTGERIRDKIAASKRKGMWMGGCPPLGYDAHEHRLLINEDEAVKVRDIFDRYLRLGSVRPLQLELDRDGIRSKRRISTSGRASGGHSFSRGALYKLLSNPIYVGEIRHRCTSYPGQHLPIIERDIWEQTAARLRQRQTRPSQPTAGGAPSLLLGKLFDEQGEGLTPTHTKKGQRRYRYYISRSLLKGVGQEGWRLSAAELDGIVLAAVKQMLGDQRLLVAAVEAHDLAASQLATLLRVATERGRRLESVPQGHEQLRALVERVELRTAGLRLTLRLPLPTATHREANILVTHDLPLQIRRRGVEKRLLIGGAAAPRVRIDPALLKAVARAHCWLDDLLSGRVASMAAIGEREGVSKRYVSRVIRLGLLAPKIVEMIAEGAQAPELTAQSLLTGEKAIACSWRAQRQAFGLAVPA
jgi:DNA invertase Pin-like site-specific DNA recombinase